MKNKLAIIAALVLASTSVVTAYAVNSEKMTVANQQISRLQEAILIPSQRQCLWTLSGRK